MLIAVDTNVLLDLASEMDDVIDAVFIIRHRLNKCQMVFPPTAREELAHEASYADSFDKQERARHALQVARSSNIQPADLLETQHDMARRMGRRPRKLGLLPEEEVNDALILAEAALLNCAILLTTDAHLRGIDFMRLALEFKACSVAAPIIATPREVVHKFFV
jgi:predicted nucleic acid-binding protein